MSTARPPRPTVRESVIDVDLTDRAVDVDGQPVPIGHHPTPAAAAFAHLAQLAARLGYPLLARITNHDAHTSVPMLVEPSGRHRLDLDGPPGGAPRSAANPTYPPDPAMEAARLPGSANPSPAATNDSADASAAVSDLANPAQHVATRRAISGFHRVVTPSVLCMQELEKRRPGRPSKGPRATLVGKVHPEVSTAVRAAAAARGVTLNDYLAELLAGTHGLPQHIPASGHDPLDRSRLPLSA